MRHPGINHTIRKLELHPTRDLLLSCSAEAATLWSTTTFGRLRALNAEKTRPLLDAAFVPPADTLLTCFESAVVQWTGPTFGATATYHVNPDAVRLKTITVSSDGALLIGAGEGGWLLEVGSFIGGSARTFVRAAKRLGLSTPIVCVDTWAGDVAVRDRASNSAP